MPDRAMLPDYFQSMMSKIANQFGDEPAKAQLLAIDLMCEALKKAGYGDGVEVYELMEKP